MLDDCGPACFRCLRNVASHTRAWLLLLQLAFARLMAAPTSNRVSISIRGDVNS
jgi:hypothetical protein